MERQKQEDRNARLAERRKAQDEKKRLEEERRLKIERSERDARLAEGVENRRRIRAHLEELKSTRDYEKTRQDQLRLETEAENDRITHLETIEQNRIDELNTIESNRLHECMLMEGEEIQLRSLLNREAELRDMEEEDVLATYMRQYTVQFNYAKGK